MIWKGLFVGMAALSCLGLLFVAPSGGPLVSEPSAGPAQRQATTHGRSSTSRTRYAFVGGYYGGGK